MCCKSAPTPNAIAALTCARDRDVTNLVDAGGDEACRDVVSGALGEADVGVDADSDAAAWDVTTGAFAERAQPAKMTESPNTCAPRETEIMARIVTLSEAGGQASRAGIHPGSGDGRVSASSAAQSASKFVVGRGVKASVSWPLSSRKMVSTESRP